MVTLHREILSMKFLVFNWIWYLLKLNSHVRGASGTWQIGHMSRVEIGIPLVVELVSQVVARSNFTVDDSSVFFRDAFLTVYWTLWISYIGEPRCKIHRLQTSGRRFVYVVFSSDDARYLAGSFAYCENAHRKEKINCR